MALTTRLIDGVNPFLWEEFKCPLCGGNEFTSICHSGVYCDECNCKFNVRDTAGDPGCVVDCYATKDKGGYVYSPVYECSHCDAKQNLFGWQDITCPVNLNHGDMVCNPRLRGSWHPSKDYEYFYMILKLGDYCSGWLPRGIVTKGKNGPTEAQWEAFQKEQGLR